MKRKNKKDMSTEEIKEVLENHSLWLNNKGGKRADLRWMNLRGVDLCCANLCDATFIGADLRGADLYKADLRNANLRCANLSKADLRYADLRGADLRGANLRYANISYSCWPLWCGSLDIKIDAQIAAQLMYHALRAMMSVKGDADIATVLANPDIIRLANRFKRVDECGQIVAKGESRSTDDYEVGGFEKTA